MDNFYYEFSVIVRDKQGNKLVGGGGICRKSDILSHITEWVEDQEAHDGFSVGKVTFEIDFSTGKLLWDI